MHVTSYFLYSEQWHSANNNPCETSSYLFEYISLDHLPVSL